ncbi:MAG: flagellar hook capping FlgD N-terminal domain-containing protein [Pseudomonadota bacterium]
MDVNETSVNGVPVVSGGNSGSITDAGSLSETFDNFLTLLTTQLQNQDPLSPMDTNQFTEQLVQFSSVEQALATNEKLDQLISLQGGSNLNAAVAYLGNEITASGEQLSLQDGTARISYTLGTAAAEATLLISNPAGTVLRALPIDTEAGRHDVTWDGTDAQGNSLPDGVYNFTVAARDGDGEPLTATQEFHGTVTGVRTDNGNITLVSGGLEISADDITAVRAPSEEDDS